jgi:hypothetical protein
MIVSRRNSVDDETLSAAIRNVLELVNTDVRFVLVKYYGLLTNILDYIDDDVPKWMLDFDQMLEMGSLNYNELELISQGVDRSVAIELDIPREVNDVEKYLSTESDVSSFYQSHLQKYGFETSDGK